jgi:galactokinase
VGEVGTGSAPHLTGCLNLSGMSEGLNIHVQHGPLRSVQVDHDFVGVQCGVMDQLASSLADTRTLLPIDTRPLERRAAWPRAATTNAAPRRR